MGTLARPYGRRDRPFNPTPVPHWVAVIVPLLLTIILITLAAHLLPQARSLFIEAAQESPPFPVAASGNSTSIDSPSENLSIFTPEVRRWEKQIMLWAEQYGLPSSLIALVMQIESCGAPDVVSSAGAIGLFQVMPFHFSVQEDPFDTEVNASRGLTYLARSFELANGSIEKTLAGYNGGHSTIDWDPLNWPEETRRYVRWGSGIWEDLQSGSDQSDSLFLWLASGGEHLCQRSRQADTVN